MLDVVLIILFFFAILLLVYSVSERSVAWCFMDVVIWLILALFMLQGVEIPYQMFNATSGNIETGVQTIQTNLDPLAYLFMGIAAVMFIMSVVWMMEYITDSKKNRL